MTAEYTVFTELVSNFGFPMIMCVYMIVVNNKTVRENTQVTQKMCDLLQGWIDKYQREFDEHVAHDKEITKP